VILFFKTNVKGHFRRLSSGKTVWVKGHQDKRLEHHDSQRQAEDVRVKNTWITGDEIDRSPGDSLQARAIAFARANLQGKTFHNEPTGWEISIGRRGINKTTSHAGREEHARSVAALPGLLQNSVKVFTEPNTNQRERVDVPWVHHFYAPLIIRGKFYIARLVIKETRSGQRFYDHDLSEEISPTDHGASAHLPKEGAAHEQVGPNLSIDGLMSFVKPEHRPPQGGA